MSLTLTPAQQASIAALVQRMELSAGLGTEEHACSIAAINLALTGELTDSIPACMSSVIGEWIIRVQDRMPLEMRNSSEWKRLLPLAAGTGRTKEPERLSIVMDWMWESLKLVQPFADANGFGEEWTKMCIEKSIDAAYAAARAANAAARAANATATHAANAAYAAYAATATHATHAANAANAANAAARAGLRISHFITEDDAWQAINPPGLLERLIHCRAES
jgi:hypothetical protein